jgi:two-component system, NtrC family, response regulator GlrR
MGQTRILVLNAKEDAEGLFPIEDVIAGGRQFAFEIFKAPVLDAPPSELQQFLPELLTRHRPSLLLPLFSRRSMGRAQSVFGVLNDHGFEGPVVALTESTELNEVQQLLLLGADDFVMPPLKCSDILIRLWKLVHHQEGGLPETQRLKEKFGLDHFVGESPQLVGEIQKVPRIAACDATLLIQGETGTGKELIARAVHYLSPRAGKPFVPVNCGALPLDLIENELFGHEQGAYTSAAKPAPGLIQEADGGTLFLDEINTMPAAAQVKLLRFLQDKEYRPLGSARHVRADVRLITAANTSLEDLVGTGQFRRDLYYRLNVLFLVLPPLRVRSADVPLLARHFLKKYAARFHRPARDLTATSLNKLQRYDWPGNVRELENVMERAVIMSEQFVLRPDDIPLPSAPSPAVGRSFRWLKAKAVADFERGYIKELLAECDGNITRAARLAKKNRRAFWELMRKHRIEAQSA